MGLESKLKELLEYSSENAIGTALSSASIGGKVRVRIDGVIRGQKGTVTVTSGSNIVAGQPVGLSLDGNNKIIAICQQSEVIREETIINDLWEEEVPKDPPKPTEKPLVGVVLFAVANKLSQTGEPPVPNCTCPAINRVQPNLNPDTYPSCLEDPRVPSAYDDAVGRGSAGKEYHAYQELGRDWNPGMPYGFNMQVFRSFLPHGFRFQRYTALDFNDYFISTPFNEAVDGKSILVFRGAAQFSAVVTDSDYGFPIFGGPDYSKPYLQAIYGKDNPLVAALLEGLTNPADLVSRLRDLGPTGTPALSNMMLNYLVRPNQLGGDIVSIKAAEYEMWWWSIREITNPYIPWQHPVHKNFRVLRTGIISGDAPSGTVLIRNYGGATSQTGGKLITILEKTSFATFAAIPPPEEGGGDSPYFNEDGSNLNPERQEVEFFNTDFYVGGFGEKNLKLPVNLRGDDPYWGYLERVDTEHYEAIILTGSEVVEKTRANAEYFEKYDPARTFIGSENGRLGLWDLALDKAYDKDNRTTTDSILKFYLEYPNCFRYCKAYVFKIRIKDGVGSILSQKEVNYPNKISDLADERRWLNFVNTTNTAFQTEINPSPTEVDQQEGFFTSDLPTPAAFSPPYLSSWFLENIKNAAPLYYRSDFQNNPGLGIRPDTDFQFNVGKRAFGLKDMDFLKRSYQTYLNSKKGNLSISDLEETSETENTFYWLRDEDYIKSLDILGKWTFNSDEETLRNFEFPPDVSNSQKKHIKVGRLSMGDTTIRIDSQGNQVTGNNGSILTNPVHLGNSRGNTSDSFGERIQVSTTFFNQDPLQNETLFTTPHKGIDIEIRGNRLTMIHLNQATKSSSDNNMSLGGAIISQLPTEDDYKIKGKVATYEIEKQTITGVFRTYYPSKRGTTNFIDYNLRESEATFNLIKCPNVNPESKEKYPFGYFGSLTYEQRLDQQNKPSSLIQFQPNLKPIEFFPIRRPEYYAIAILGVATN